MSVRMIILIHVLILILHTVGCSSLMRSEVMDVYDVHLNSRDLDGELVKVRGILSVGWEDNALHCLIRRDDVEGCFLNIDLSKEGLVGISQVDQIHERIDELQGHDGHCVILRGIFDQEMTGHLVSRRGGLRNITIISEC